MLAKRFVSAENQGRAFRFETHRKKSTPLVFLLLLQDEIQDLTKKTKIDSKDIFVEHVIFCKQHFQKLNNVLTLRWKLSANVDFYNTRDRTQYIQHVKTKSKILPRFQRSKILPRFPRSKILSRYPR